MWQVSVALAAGVAAAQLTSFASFAYPLDRLFASCLAVKLALGTRVAAAYGIGILLYLLHAVCMIDSRGAPQFTGDNILTQVRVLGFPASSESGTRFLAEPLGDGRLPERTRLSWRAPRASLHGGDTWELVVRLKSPRGAMNPGGFDSEAWLFRERIGATGYVVSSRRNRLLSANDGGMLLAMRQALERRISRVVAEPAEAAVLKAIGIGVRHDLSDEQWERYARTGTSHLMAISGLHVGLAAAACYGLTMLLLAAIRARGYNQAYAVAFSLFAAGSYVLLSGAAVPAIRAFVMLLVASLALVRTSRLTGFDGWALALLAVTALDPLAAGNAGYLLSFGAVFLLLWLARQKHAGSRLRLVVRLQWVLLFGLLPATVMLFDRFAPAAPLLNLCVVPVFSFVTVPATLLGLVLDGPFSPLGDPLLRIAAGTVRWVDFVLASPAWPAADVKQSLGLYGGLYAVATVAWACLPPGWPGRWLSVPALAGLIAWQPGRPAPGCVDISVLDVGQGQAIVAETHGYTLLYDTGPGYPGDIGKSRAVHTLLPFLERRGIGAIDTTVISHADIDHAGGIADLAAAMPLGRRLAGEPLAGVAATSCHLAGPWQRDGLRFEFVTSGKAASGNNASCVLAITAGTTRVLLTGDIERPVEEQLVASGRVIRSAVVTVPHHGSRTSSSTGFIAAVNADYAIVSAGWANRWGFPKPDIVARWSRQGATVLSTGESGAIRVRVCPVGPGRPRLERSARRRIWHSH